MNSLIETKFATKTGAKRGAITTSALKMAAMFITALVPVLSGFSASAADFSDWQQIHFGSSVTFSVNENNVFRIEATDYDIAGFEKTFIVKPNTTYTFSAEVFSDSKFRVDTWEEYRFCAGLCDLDDYWIRTPYNIEEDGWQTLSLYINSGNRTQITLGLRQGYQYSPTRGITHFRNIRLLEHITENSTETVYELLFNPPAVVNAQTPYITEQPAGRMVNENINVTLSVAVSAVIDGGTLSYQWYSNTTDSNAGGTAILGATNTSYSVPTSTAGTWYYYVIVTNTNNSVNGTKTATQISNTAAVVVNSLVNAQTVIHLQPFNLTVWKGAETTLSLLAYIDGGGGELTYQWYSNTTNSAVEGTAVAGATEPDFHPNTQAVGKNYYYCVITNSKNASVTSDVVFVDVLESVTRTIAPPMYKKLLVLDFDPYLPTRGMLFSDYMHYQPTKKDLVEETVERLHRASHGIINYEIIYERLDEFALWKLRDGSSLRMDREEFPTDWENENFTYETFDVLKREQGLELDFWHYFDSLDLINRRNAEEFDEIWIPSEFGGIPEAMMVGRGAYGINGNPIEADCEPFRISGDCMECLGHSMDWGILQFNVFEPADFIWSGGGYGGLFDVENGVLNENAWKDPSNRTTWDRFTQIDKYFPGNAAIGTMHYAPFSKNDYWWNCNMDEDGNLYEMSVLSTWRDWRDNYPFLTGKKEMTSRLDWGNAIDDISLAGNGDNHKEWWFSCIPHVTGRDEKGFSHNWWEYYQNLVVTRSLEIQIDGSTTNSYTLGADTYKFSVFATLSSRTVIDVTDDITISAPLDENGNPYFEIDTENGTIKGLIATDEYKTLTVWRDGRSCEISLNFNKSAGIDKLAPENPLKAEMQNEMLYVSGLISGEVWSVYSVSGMLIYCDVASSKEANIPLTVRGVYIIQSGNNTIKIVY